MLPVQAVVSSARTLQDITDERVVPVDYLGVLILLFMLLVLDRLFYSLGLHLGKVPFPKPLHPTLLLRQCAWNAKPLLCLEKWALAVTLKSLIGKQGSLFAFLLASRH